MSENDKGLSERAALIAGIKMSLKNDLLKKLKENADNPTNEFDRIIHNNREALDIMDEKSLSEIYTLRRKGSSLCGLIPYSREDIKELTESGEVSAHDKVAELEDCFTAAEYIFARAKGEIY